jgi:hypothetical protein
MNKPKMAHLQDGHVKGKPDARLLAATMAVVLGASSYAAIGAALGTYSLGPLPPEELAK